MLFILDMMMKAFMFLTIILCGYFSYVVFLEIIFGIKSGKIPL